MKNRSEFNNILETLKTYDIGVSEITVKSIVGQLLAKHIESLMERDPVGALKVVKKGADYLMKEAEYLILTENFNFFFDEEAFGYEVSRFSEKNISKSA